MNALMEEFEKTSVRLARDESGVALMLTLAVFLLLFVVCAGVFTIGETIREKMELQNICDSAAYSAAVVQADGLSRMAMINRAMSWTYVQLTNAQLDYITYRWMARVRDHFKEDRKACKEWNDLTFGVSFCGCDFFLYSKYKGEGKGWFCGLAGEGSGNIRMNGKTVSFDTLDQEVDRISQSEIANYGGLIGNLKGVIESYNAFLHVVNSQMIESIPATVGATIVANLPKLNGKMDVDVAKDMLWYVDHPSALDPYAAYDEGADSETAGATYYRPLFNTETDERIFLSMADNTTYDRLEPYFSNGSSSQTECGGLDQWFIRGFKDEASADATEVKLSSEAYTTPGICRVYKNTNRSEFPFIRRGHHVNGTLSMNGMLSGLSLDVDVPPSCYHGRALYPEQCSTVKETTALYADYDWCSFQMHWACWWRQLTKYLTLPYHTQYGLVMPICKSGHVCCISPFSHRRSGYKPCFVNPIKLAADEAKIAYKSKWITHPTVNLTDLMANPYGHTRIYGDDKDLYDEDAYTGAVAKPWILGPEFFGRQGAIVVGLARKQRNPWSWLFASGNASDGTQQTKGIYSAFNPTSDGYVVAFSASRAAFRHSANGAGMREYETRYDSVCHNDAESSKFKLKDGASFFGCVCNNSENQERLKRCWNLCTSDWDATLLPLAYAQADVQGATYDSYRPSEISWETISARAEDDFLNPFEKASVTNWTCVVDKSGELVTEEDTKNSVNGEFLWFSAPSGMSGGRNPPVFNLTEAIKRRML